MIVVIHGPPAAGKTTLATALARRLGVVRISRDALTERLLDTLGVHDPAWTRRLGHAAHELMLDLMEELAIGNVPFVVDATFNPESACARIAHILSQGDQRAVEVFLHAPAEVLLERYRERATASGRHPGHHDDTRFTQLGQHLRECEYQPLGFAGNITKVDAEQPPADVLNEVLAALATAP